MVQQQQEVNSDLVAEVAPTVSPVSGPEGRGQSSTETPLCCVTASSHYATCEMGLVTASLGKHLEGRGFPAGLLHL